MSVEETKSLKSNLNVLKKSFENSFQSLSRTINVLKSVASSPELTVLELPNARKVLQETVTQIDNFTSGPQIDKLRLLPQLESLKDHALKVIHQCNQERLDYKVLESLRTASDSLAKSLGSLKKNSKKVKDKFEILQLVDLIESLQQFKVNLDIAKDFTDSFTDFAPDYVGKLDEVGSILLGFSLFVDDVVENIDSITDIDFYNRETLKNLKALEESLNNLNSCVVLNEKMEVLSQAATIFSEKMNEIWKIVDMKIMERREDIQFIERLKSTAYTVEGNIKQIHDSVFRCLLSPLKLLQGSLDDIENVLRTEKPADIKPLLLQKMNFDKSLIKCEKYLRESTHTYQITEGLLLITEELKDSIMDHMNIFKTVDTFLPLKGVMDIWLKVVSNLVVEIKAELEQMSEDVKKGEETERAEDKEVGIDSVPKDYDKSKNLQEEKEKEEVIDETDKERQDSKSQDSKKIKKDGETISSKGVSDASQTRDEKKKLDIKEQEDETTQENYEIGKEKNEVFKEPIHEEEIKNKENTDNKKEELLVGIQDEYILNREKTGQVEEKKMNQEDQKAVADAQIEKGEEKKSSDIQEQEIEGKYSKLSPKKRKSVTNEKEGTDIGNERKVKDEDKQAETKSKGAHELEGSLNSIKTQKEFDATEKKNDAQREGNIMSEQDKQTDNEKAKLLSEKRTPSMNKEKQVNDEAKKESIQEEKQPKQLKKREEEAAPGTKKTVVETEDKSPIEAMELTSRKESVGSETKKDGQQQEGNKLMGRDEEANEKDKLSPKKRKSLTDKKKKTGREDEKQIVSEEKKSEKQVECKTEETVTVKDKSATVTGIKKEDQEDELKKVNDLKKKEEDGKVVEKETEEEKPAAKKRKSIANKKKQVDDKDEKEVLLMKSKIEEDLKSKENSETFQEKQVDKSSKIDKKVDSKTEEGQLSHKKSKSPADKKKELGAREQKEENQEKAKDDEQEKAIEKKESVEQTQDALKTKGKTESRIQNDVDEKDKKLKGQSVAEEEPLSNEKPKKSTGKESQKDGAPMDVDGLKKKTVQTEIANSNEEAECVKFSKDKEDELQESTQLVEDNIRENQRSVLDAKKKVEKEELPIVKRKPKSDSEVNKTELTHEQQKITQKPPGKLWSGTVAPTEHITHDISKYSYKNGFEGESLHNSLIIEGTTERDLKRNRESLEDTLAKSRELSLHKQDQLDLLIYKPSTYHGPRFAHRKPLFTSNLSDRTTTVGSRIKMTCSVIGDDDLQIVWLKNGEEVSSPNYNIEFSNNVATLEILNTSLNDSADYTCIARNANGVTTTSAKLNITESYEFVPLPPTFTRGLKDYTTSNDELIVECRLRYIPSPKIRWFKDGNELGVGLRHTQSYSADGVCKLTIKNPTANDNGKYTCRVENDEYYDQISREVDINSKKTYRYRPLRRRDLHPTSLKQPYFSSVLTDAIVPQGGVMALQVEVKGCPTEVSWFKESLQLPRASPRHRTFNEKGIHTLILPDIQDNEAGKYSCRAINAHGKIETSAYVQVIQASSIRDGKPAMFLSRPDKILNLALGEDVVVSFRVTGSPKPGVTWMKGLTDITSSLRSMKETSDDYSRFTLKRVTMEDVGTYCILAKNRYGCDRAFFTVRLRHRARSVTPPRSIPDPVPSYRERYNMTDVPGPIPGGPVVVDSGRNWISLSWGKPEHRGAAPVVAYRVEAWMKGAEGARWVELGISGNNSFDAFNLKQGGEYQFRITPRNRYGWGESVQSDIIVVGKHDALPEFTKILPGQLKALLGSDVTLECEVRCDPYPSMRWYRDSSEIFEEDDNRYQMTENNGVCRLKITNLQDSDSGRYMCEAVNKIGRVSTFVRLYTVRDPKILLADQNLKTNLLDIDKTTQFSPQFTMRLRDRRVQVSYPVRLTCQIAGCPEPTVKWFRDGEEIISSDRHSFWTDGNFQTLEISKTVLEDSGTYCVTAQNNFGSISCRCNLTVDKGIKAYIAPEFSENIEPSYFEIEEGSELRLSGRVMAYPAVGIMWYKDGVRLRPSRRSVMTLSYDGRLELSVGGVTPKDSGFYTCVVSNEVGRAESTARIAIIGKSEQQNGFKEEIVSLPYSKEPKFLKKPLSTVAYEGDNIVILCEVVGDPKPEVVWLRDFLKPNYYRDAAHFHCINDGPEYRLEIPNAKLDFTGTYTVYAKNEHGDAKAIISLQIKVRDPDAGISVDRKKIGEVKIIPKIELELCDIRCCDGDSATFECKIQGTPPPNIRWEKAGKLIHLGGDFTADFNGEIAKLRIEKVYPEDEGEYTCVAYNELGKSLTSACLIVDIPEEKDNYLRQHLIRPPGLLNGSTPISTPRTTPIRSTSPHPRDREITTSEPRYRRIRATAPKFYSYPHNRIAEEGETVRFQCAVAGHPDPWVTWQKDGKIVTPSAKIRITEREDIRTLEISEVTHSDSGIYKIILENDVGRVEASAKLDVIHHRVPSSRGLRARSLSPRAAPIYTRSLVAGSATIGSRARLFCDIRATPTPFLRWYKDDVPLENNYKYRSSFDGSTAVLEIESVDMEDNGLYKCVATNSNGTAETYACLDVKEMKYIPPTVVRGLQKNLHVSEGSSARFELEVNGSQPFDIIWLKDGCLLPDSVDFRQNVTEDGVVSLCLPDVYREDAGHYRCEVYNICGDACSSCQLEVLDYAHVPRVEFIKFPNPIIVREGGDASFCVRVRSSTAEKPVITWEVAGKPVEPCQRYIVEEYDDVSILHILGVRSEEAGAVECSASIATIESSNQLSQFASGRCTDTISTRCGTELSVLEQEQVVVGVDYSSCASEEASMDQDQEDEVSSGGEPAMLLRAPQNATALVGDRVLLKVTYMGHPEPTVRWTIGGRELKNDERTSITSGDGVSCLLLQNITTDDSGKYDVCVENIHGADCSYASVSVEGPPDPPSGTPCISSTLDSVVVTWSSSPYDGGRIVDGFAVEYSMVGSDIWTTVIDECHSLSYTVRGLQPGGRYVFRVRAYNVHGYSKPGLESDIIQLEEHNESSSFEPRIVHVEPGPEFKSRYEVLEELGKGRFGVVHKVIDKQTNRKLAGKFIKCRTSRDKDKVQDEIDIMNLLRHQKLLQLAAAFESPREMIMIMEYISGGELFERVVADDFTLTEKDCILFMRQICEGVTYMHSQNVVHLDLKPENIMCHTRTSHEIKIIDFGLAQKLDPNNPVRVLFGTPEFIPPEIINYEPIGVESDMWSLGVICYVLLSGLSPFMGDNDTETFANITRADYDFDDEAFSTISQDARDFIGALLVKRKEDRLSAEKCLKHVWLDPDNHLETVVLCTDKLKKFIIRRKWQKTGNAIRALGRMATLSASRRNSANSNPTTPRQSLSGTGGLLTSVPRMSSLTEQENVALLNCDINSNNKNFNFNNTQTTLPESDETADNYAPLKILKDIKNENSKAYRSRACSERSDSGISDCSSHLTSSSCTSTPLLGKKFRISEETENGNDSTNITLILNSRNRLSQERRQSHDSETDKASEEDKSVEGDKVQDETDKNGEEDKFVSVLNIDGLRLSPDKSVNGKPPLSLKISDKLGTFNGNKPTKCTSPTAAGSLKRLPIYTSRTVAGTIKKFDPLTQTHNRPSSRSSAPRSRNLSRSVERPPDLDYKNQNNVSNRVSPKLDVRRASRVDEMLEKFSKDNPTLTVPTSQIRYRSPSPSLLRKTQAVIAKEKSNEHYMTKSIPKSPVASPKLSTMHGKSNKLSCPNSPLVSRKDKPKNENFQKAVAFWNLT